MAHSFYAPSSAERWLACPSSLQFPTVHETNVFAEEGTLAHKLATEWLTTGKEPEFPNDEMRKCIRGYVAYVRFAMADMELDGGHAYLSVERNIRSRSIEGFGGTVDVRLVNTSMMHIIDLKYGAGVPVQAAGNAQLMCYLLLAREDYRGTVGQYRMTIYQPRCQSGPEIDDTVDVTEEELNKFQRYVLDRMAAEGFEAGDHCRWCPGIVICPHLHQIAIETAQTEFAKEFDVDMLREILDVEVALKRLLEDNRKQATKALQEGFEITGYKLVDALSNRKWTMNDASVISTLIERGVYVDHAVEKKPRSPAKLEELGYRKEIDGLTTRVLNGYSVVKESDKRPASTFSTAQEDFQNGD